MSLRPCLIHSCHDQAKVFSFMQPFLSADISKADLMELWEQAAAQLGEQRPKNCRCSYRVTVQEAEKLVKNGIADYLIIDWRFNEEKHTFFPAPNLNLVWGGKQAEELGLVKSSYAAKTPRVMTIERPNLERAWCNGNSPHEMKIAQEERDRIEAWGEMQCELWATITKEYASNYVDPFEGRAVLALIGFDQRSAKGISCESPKQNIPKRTGAS